MIEPLKDEITGRNVKIAIEIANLRMTFNKSNFVLDGVTLNILRGQTTVIIGFSGAGKSVLLKLILGLLKPTSGSIKVLGQEITSMTENELLKMRLNYGMVFQDSALFDDLTAIENVIFPMTEHRPDLTRAEMVVIAKKHLKETGLEEVHYSKLPSELSGGMRKRVGVARALVLDPGILIYDEPTSGLDPILTEMVDELIIKTERHKTDTTSLIVSHDVYAAFEMADQVAMLDKGKILLNGAPKDFLNSKIEIIQKFVSQGLHTDKSISHKQQ
jgi:phospholipid/cholesterol/gamma-HCH transport system ATP-binding protein